MKFTQKTLDGISFHEVNASLHASVAPFFIQLSSEDSVGTTLLKSANLNRIMRLSHLLLGNPLGISKCIVLCVDRLYFCWGGTNFDSFLTPFADDDDEQNGLLSSSSNNVVLWQQHVSTDTSYEQVVIEKLCFEKYRGANKTIAVRNDDKLCEDFRAFVALNERALQIDLRKSGGLYSFCKDMNLTVPAGVDEHSILTPETYVKTIKEFQTKHPYSICCFGSARSNFPLGKQNHHHSIPSNLGWKDYICGR